MGTRTFGLTVALGLALCAAAVGADDKPASRIDVAVMGLRNDNGVVRCGLYKSPAGFPHAGNQWRAASVAIENQQAACVFTGVPAGTYALAVFHAEHNEKRIRYGLLGIPKEGYGFSRNPSSSFGPPSFSDASFDYKGGEMSLSVNLTYR